MIEMTDGAGQIVNEESAAEAVKQFAELWGNALFDCGPQDYEYMATEILAKFRAERVLAQGEPR